MRRALCVTLLAVLALAGDAHAQPAATLEAPRPEPPPPLRSRLGSWQLLMSVFSGVEPVDGANAVAFGTGAELLYHCRIGVFAALSSSKGNAIIATTNSSGVLQPAPGDRISVPFGLAWHPLGFYGMRPGDGARGWFHRLAAGVGLQVGMSVEHIRDSSDGQTNPAFHAALGVDVPLWGGPVEGGVLLHLQGRFIAGPAVSLASGMVQMPIFGGQLYGGLTWAL